jgi:hypothetical protein
MRLRKGIRITISGIIILWGIGLGFWAGDMIVEGRLNRWKSLGSPPERAIGIAGGYLGDSRETYIYVHDSWGTIYHCCEGNEVIWRVAPEAEVKQVVDYGCLSDNQPHVRPPKGVVDELVIHWCGEWDWGQANYIIRDDGTVWVWRYSGGFPGWIGPICGGPILGLGMGLSIARLAFHHFDDSHEKQVVEKSHA